MRIIVHDLELQPERAHEDDAGLDLKSSETFTMHPGESRTVDTGISIAGRRYWYVQLASRSGLSSKHGIVVLGGVIDSEYRGPIKTTLINLGDAPYTVERGQRICQAIELAVTTGPDVFRDADGNELAPIDKSRGARGTAGFGSTGEQ